jgi:NAD(P)-dependent dehydrogenase (short-subunit alcohol dehydrogenase family)
VQIPAPTANFSGQTVIVTSSNSDLGLEAARHLLRLNATKVILAVRSIGKGEAAAEQLLASTGATKSSVEVWPLYLSSQESANKMAERVNRSDRLDAAILNAGILTQKWTVVDGMELQFAVNVVNTTLLGLLLLPKLRESAKKYRTIGRLAFVSSDTHYIAQVNEANSPGSLFDALSSKEIAIIEDRYASISLHTLPHSLTRTVCQIFNKTLSPLRRSGDRSTQSHQPGFKRCN